MMDNKIISASYEDSKINESCMLFNKSEADTMEALRAGVLAGQTKPLRNYGLDVTDDESDAICIGDAVLKKYGEI